MRYLGAIRTFLDRVGWEAAEADDPSVLLLDVTGRNGSWKCDVVERESDSQLLVYSRHPIPVPENKRLAMAEFVNRANTETVVGNFEVDMDDGVLRYKSYVDGLADCFTDADAERMLTLNVSMMDGYLPGIMHVIAADMDPAEAVRWVESGEAERFGRSEVD